MKNPPNIKLSVTVTVALLAWSATAHAATIISPVAVVAAPPPINGNFSFDRTINQVGLSPNFVSGVTDFDTYAALSPVHNGGGNTNMGVTLSNPVQDIDYDLGGEFLIGRLAFWNYSFTDAGAVRSMEVFTSLTSDFAVQVPVGQFSVANGCIGSCGGAASVPLQTFDLTDSLARYARLRVTMTDQNRATGIGEVAFVEAVPEPSAAMLVGVALAIFGITRRGRDGRG